MVKEGERVAIRVVATSASNSDSVARRLRGRGRSPVRRRHRGYRGRRLRGGPGRRNRPRVAVGGAGTDWLVFAASSGGRGAEAAREVYVEGLRTAIDHFWSRADPPERIVTFQYRCLRDHGGAWVDEETPLDRRPEDRTAGRSGAGRPRASVEYGGHGRSLASPACMARTATDWSVSEGPVTAGYRHGPPGRRSRCRAPPPDREPP